jgi:hypothetical protein
MRKNKMASSAVRRTALLLLAVGLGLTNLVELSASFRPDFWDRVGLVGLLGIPENGKLHVTASDQNRGAGMMPVERGSQSELPSIQAGDLVSVVPPPGASRGLSFAPDVLEFFRYKARLEPIRLRVEHGQQSTLITVGHSVQAAPADLINYYGQIFVDLIFAVVGGLLAWRRPQDRAVRALAISMICWSSNIPSTTATPLFDTLFVINQLTARVWVQILLVYWAIHLSPVSRWGISRNLVRLWPLWATFTIVLGFMHRFAMFNAFPVHVSTLQALVDGNQTLLFIVPLVALTEGIFSTQGETRTRIRWGLFVFGFYFSLFPYRIYVTPWLDSLLQGQVFQVVIDNVLQLVLPLGLLYATLRHRLLDLSFAINRGLVYGAISAILLAAFFGLEKISENVLQLQGREQNALLAGCIAFGIFLFFHKVRDWVERNVERFFFSAWHRKEIAVREYVRTAAHITRVEALIASCIVAIDHYSDGAGCAIYRRNRAGNYERLRSSIADAPAEVDGNDPVILAMRVERSAVGCADAGSSLRQEQALPILYRGEVDGFMILGRKLSQEAYRPDEIDVLGYAVQQIGLDLTALEREQYKEQAAEWAAQASTARSSADEMRGLLQLALARRAVDGSESALTTSDSGGTS